MCVNAYMASECPARIEETRNAMQKAKAALDKAKAAAKAAARVPLGKAKEMLAHAEAEHKGAGQDVKKHAEAVREARTAPLCSARSEEHTSELQSLRHLVCRLLLEKKY